MRRAFGVFEVAAKLLEQERMLISVAGQGVEQHRERCSIQPALRTRQITQLLSAYTGSVFQRLNLAHSVRTPGGVSCGLGARPRQRVERAGYDPLEQCTILLHITREQSENHAASWVRDLIRQASVRPQRYRLVKHHRPYPMQLVHRYQNAGHE